MSISLRHFLLKIAYKLSKPDLVGIGTNTDARPVVGVLDEPDSA
jgi:hypothetical protein